jgi:pimeloyl-ACP methyl ester carboxylesterase
VNTKLNLTKEEKLMDTSHEELVALVERFMRPKVAPPTARDEELLRQGENLALDLPLVATAWGNGPIVLLAHGWNSRRTHWSGFIPALVEAGLRAVSIDAPAHGDSAGSSAHVLMYAIGLLEVGQALGPLAGVIGHSWGGGALAIAMKRGLQAERAVLIASPCSFTRLIAEWCRHHHLQESEIGAFLNLVSDRVGVGIGELDLDHIVRRLHQPALIIHDQRDDDIPVAEAHSIAQAWPGARLMITERFGHKRILLAKEVVRQAVAFLKNEPI